MRKLPLVILSFLLSATVSALAQSGGCQQRLSDPCPGQLYNSTPPALLNQKLAANSQGLCFSEFAVLHSGLTRTPLWSAEQLTADRIRNGQVLPRPRSNAFHSEPCLSASRRSELSDYKGSGYDRGHMSPNGDMSTPESQQESFSLANIIPQTPSHNRRLWAGIESAVRSLTHSQGMVYVVTGPAFVGEQLQSLEGRVVVPTNVFKAIFIPSSNAAGAYWTPNDDSQKCESVSIVRLLELTGIDVFPGLDAALRQTPMNLPRCP